MPLQSKVERAAYQREWRKQNREYMHAKDFLYQLRYLYGLEPDDYFRMVLDQEGKCKLCSDVMTFGDKGNKQCCVDHDHVTEKVRGLLCMDCNRRVGFYETSNLVAIRQYLGL